MVVSDSRATGCSSVAIAPVIYAKYQTWVDMRALEQELKPFQEAARAIEDSVGQGQPGIPTHLLGMRVRLRRELACPPASSLCVSWPVSMPHDRGRRSPAGQPPGNRRLSAGGEGCQQRPAPARSLRHTSPSCPALDRAVPGPGGAPATGGVPLCRLLPQHDRMLHAEWRPTCRQQGMPGRPSTTPAS